jgi:hypothetical protein
LVRFCARNNNLSHIDNIVVLPGQVKTNDDLITIQQYCLYLHASKQHNKSQPNLSHIITTNIEYGLVTDKHIDWIRPHGHRIGLFISALD